MISLLVSDIDGCISHPFQPPHWEAISQIRKWNQLSKDHSTIPSLTLCTGRPLSYAEAVAQWLDVDQWIIFESGAGMYHPKTNELRWSPQINNEVLALSQHFREWIEKDIIVNDPHLMLEFTKKLDVGLVGTNPKQMEHLYHIIRKYVSLESDVHQVHYTDVSVNIVFNECTKGTGLTWLSEETGIPLLEMGYIGDGMNDISAMKICGSTAAPSNARLSTKECAHWISKEEATLAVKEFYERLSDENTRELTMNLA